MGINIEVKGKKNLARQAHFLLATKWSYDQLLSYWRSELGRKDL